MPKKALDADAAIEAIISVLRTTTARDALLHSPFLLIEQVKARKFDWQQAADILGVPKSRLYHWFRETYQRNMKDPLTAQDLALLKALVYESMDQNEAPELVRIRPRLSRDYDKQVLYVAFQNAKQVVSQRCQRAASANSALQKKNVVPELNLNALNKSDSAVNSTRSTVEGSSRSAVVTVTLDLSSDNETFPSYDWMM